MRKGFFDKLCCPFDKQDLRLEVFKEEDEEIREGLMTCTHCERYFPVIHGIPIMTPDEYRQHKLEAPILERWGFQVDEKKEKFHLKEKIQKN